MLETRLRFARACASFFSFATQYFASAPTVAPEHCVCPAFDAHGEAMRCAAAPSSRPLYAFARRWRRKRAR